MSVSFALCTSTQAEKVLLWTRLLPGRRLSRRRGHILLPADLIGAIRGRYASNGVIEHLCQNFLVGAVEGVGDFSSHSLPSSELELLLELPHGLRVHRRHRLARTAKRRRYRQVTPDERHVCPLSAPARQLVCACPSRLRPCLPSDHIMGLQVGTNFWK